MKKKGLAGFSLVGVIMVGVLLFTLVGGGPTTNIEADGWVSFEASVALAAGMAPEVDIFAGGSYQPGVQLFGKSSHDTVGDVGTIKKIIG